MPVYIGIALATVDREVFHIILISFEERRPAPSGFATTRDDERIALIRPQT